MVVHLGLGEWVIADSCVDPDSGQAVALRYLEGLGVDISEAVKLVVVTHWHDDHIRGISQVVKAAEDASFVCSRHDHSVLLRAIAASREQNLPGRSGLDELSSALEVLQARRDKRQRAESVGPTWAAEGQLLFQSTEPGRDRAAVTALSPSEGTENLTLHELAAFLPEKNKTQRRAVALTPNQRSIVLLVTVGSLSVLLGGDLEESANPAVGWQAVVASRVRPEADPARIFKVPHHGSENADNTSVWSQLLETGPIALIAPFSGGQKPLPSPGDVARLSARTDRLYCTAPPTGWKPARRDPTVERTIREVASARRTISREVGHIRVRLSLTDANAEPSVDLFPPAYKLDVA